MTLRAGDALDEAIIANMDDAVMTVDTTGTVVAYNPAAARVFGLPADEVIGARFAEVFFGDEGRDAFNEVVLDAMYEARTVHRRIVDYRCHGGDLKLDVTTTQLLDDEGRRLGVIVVASDETELERLRAAEAAFTDRLKAQHQELQASYRKLEESAARLDAMARRVQVVRLAATGFVFLLFAGLAWIVWDSGSVPGGAVASTGAAGERPVMEVRPTPVRSTVAVVGRLEPGEIVNVVAPFDGKIRERRFVYGSRVERGDVVIVMDTTELEIKVRESRSTYIKARQQLDDVKGWEHGAEMSRARRQVESAQESLSSLQTKMAETKRLLDKGIVAAQEYRGLEEQLGNQQRALESARQDLAATRRKGTSEYVRLAEYEHENARTRLAQLEAQLENAVVRAPVSGIALEPPPSEEKSAGSGRIEVGGQASAGRTMFAIGGLESFTVRAKIDEVDINKIRVGQSVRVSGDAFADMPMTGHVETVSSQAASQGGGGQGLPSFDVVVKIDSLAVEQRERVRVGMSADLSIVTYESPQAIVVPASALRRGPEGPYVQVPAGDGGPPRDLPVRTGITTMSGVEVVSGLAPGERIYVR